MAKSRTQKNSGKVRLLTLVPLLGLMALSLQGCETRNTGTGFVQGKHGYGAEQVYFQVINSLGSNVSIVEARFASGEIYSGKFIAATSETSSDFDLDFDDDDFNGLSSSTTYSSKAKGVLFTRSGKSMQCSMTLATPSFGFDGGAVGSCKTSTGDVIAMQLNAAG